MQRKIITLMSGTLQKVIQVNAFLNILRFSLNFYLNNRLLLLYFTKVYLRNLKQHQKRSAVSKYDLGLSLLLTIATGQLHQVKMMVNWSKLSGHLLSTTLPTNMKTTPGSTLDVSMLQSMMKDYGLKKVMFSKSVHLYLLHSRFNIIFVNFSFGPLQADERNHFEPFPCKGHCQTFTCSPNLQPWSVPLRGESLCTKEHSFLLPGHVCKVFTKIH